MTAPIRLETSEAVDSLDKYSPEQQFDFAKALVESQALHLCHLHGSATAKDLGARFIKRVEAGKWQTADDLYLGFQHEVLDEIPRIDEARAAAQAEIAKARVTAAPSLENALANLDRFLDHGEVK